MLFPAAAQNNPCASPRFLHPASDRSRGRFVAGPCRGALLWPSSEGVWTATRGHVPHSADTHSGACNNAPSIMGLAGAGGSTSRAETKLLRQDGFLRLDGSLSRPSSMWFSVVVIVGHSNMHCSSPLSQQAAGGVAPEYPRQSQFCGLCPLARILDTQPPPRTPGWRLPSTCLSTRHAWRILFPWGLCTAQRPFGDFRDT